MTLGSLSQLLTLTTAINTRLREPFQHFWFELEVAALIASPERDPTTADAAAAPFLTAKTANQPPQ